MRSQLGEVAWSAFMKMFNTDDNPKGAEQLIQEILKRNCGNEASTMADMLRAVKDKLGGGMSVLGTIKIGPITLTNYVAQWDSKIKEFDNRAKAASNANGCGNTSGVMAYTGVIPFRGGF